jgi:hypothetical protein
MQQIPDKALDQERRRFFRIDDSIHLSLREVPEEELEQRLQGLEQREGESFTLMTSLNAITQQVAPTLRRIEQAYPDIADYLKAIDKKLDLISRTLLVEEAEMAEKPAWPVNLSAGGLSVQSRAPIAEGTVLEMKLLLLPSYTGILTYGKVVSCSGPDQGKGAGEGSSLYQVRIDFSFMRDRDRDALIRHVLLKQAEWLRRYRERREP